MTANNYSTPTKSDTIITSYSRHFLEWLNQMQVSLALTTYQSNRLCLIGVQPDGQISTPAWEFDRPMGLYATAQGFYLATRYEIKRFENVLENGELLQEKYDRLYVPRASHTTGDLDVHDLVADARGNIVFTNTEYSCLATLHPQHSFTPIWKPEFISKLAPEDRCHLNGLATVNRLPRYVTAISRSDAAAGWRQRLGNGGIAIDIQTNEIIARGLSMPHSPRWYRGKLWLLNSGTGDFGYIEKGEFVPVTFCPGYPRGLAFVGNFAVVGLSKLRDTTFLDLVLNERLQKKDVEARCGVRIIDLTSGDAVHWLDLDLGCFTSKSSVETEGSELYDVAVLPGVRCPMAVGLKSGNISKLITIGSSATGGDFYFSFLDNTPPSESVNTLTGSQENVSNLSVSAQAATKPKKQRSLLPLAIVLFRATNWQQQSRLIQSLSLMYELAERKVNLPSVSFLSNPKTNTKKQKSSQKSSAYFSQGQALKKAGKLDEALIYFQKAIEVNPKNFSAYNNLGTISQAKGELERAIYYYQETLKIKNDSFQTITNLASIYLVEGELNKAEEGFKIALKLQPDFVPALYNLGLVYKSKGKLNDAIELLQTATKNQPNYADAYVQLGQIWEFQAQFNLAKNAYERVQQLNPKAKKLIFPLLGWIKVNLCDWDNYDVFVQQLIDSTAKYVKAEKEGATLAPFQLNAIPLPPELSQAVARRNAEAINKSIASKKLQFSYSKKINKIRVGYVSPDFRNHAVGRLISGIFKRHNRDKFEVFGYHLLNADDEVTETIKNGCDEFRNLYELSAENAVRQINDDGIDILIDLAGYTGYSKPEIFAYQPAPVQATFLGYPNTMGADFIQYLLTDEWVVPAELAKHYSEEIIYLPHQFICSPMQVSEKRFVRADFGLPESGFVFACFNRHYKITPELFDVWMRVLKQVEGSVLWLSLAIEEVMENLWENARSCGVAPERLIFAQKQPHPEYLARLQLADLALDTFIYNGGSTAVAALWAGVPMLTKPGLTNASRMGASICASANLPEAICRSVEEYEGKAVRLASHPEELKQWRQRLGRREGPLFDVSGFVAGLEEAFVRMWDR